MFNRESEGSKNQTENKTSKCFALVNELECLDREMENAMEDIGKLKSRVKTEHTSGKVIERRLEVKNVQHFSGRLPYLYEPPFLPEGQQPSKS